MNHSGVLIASHCLWPVGQGGFATGEVVLQDGHDEPFEYAYDCGSNRPTLLRRRIHEFSPSPAKLDLLFLSHLDADHANGIDELCLVRQIDTVVLPYLDHAAALWAAAAAVDDGGGGWALFELLTDPRRWAHRRGILRLLFVERSNGESGPSPEALPESPKHPPEEGGPRWAVDGNLLPVEPQPEPTVALLKRRSLLRCQVNSTTTWVFVPHVPPVDLPTLALFVAEVGRQIPSLQGLSTTPINGPGLPFPVLEACLRDPATRKLLKAAYRVINAAHNAVSLMLFSGPVTFSTQLLRLEQAGWAPELDVERFGYLLTGDAPVHRASHEPSFLATYRDWLPRTHLAQLPHHGSVLSVSHRFFEKLGNVEYVATVGRNKHGHPSPQVLDWATAAGRYRRVDEYDGSRFFQTIRAIK